MFFVTQFESDVLDDSSLISRKSEYICNIFCAYADVYHYYRCSVSEIQDCVCCIDHQIHVGEISYPSIYI